MPALPNILEFIWHDLGDWLSCYDRPDVPSPHLQRLADEGAVVVNHFCTAPQCTPSRGSLKTGRYPQQHGLMGLTHRGWRYHANERDLPILLAEAGYQTLLAGAQHERPLGELTYGEHLVKSSHATEVAPVAAAWLRQQSVGDQPFYLSVGFGEVHRNYGTEYDPADAERAIIPGFIPDCDMVRKDMATFYRQIRHADAAVGSVLAALAEAGLAKDTLVIFTTDHGPALPRAKMTLYDPGLRIALILRWPGHLQPGSRLTGLTSNVDLIPTLFDLLELEPPENLAGESFAHAFTSPQSHCRNAVFAQMTWHAGEYEPMRAIRCERYKYIRNYRPGWPHQMVGPYVQRFGHAFIEEHYGQPRPPVELYDLEADPWEQHNLAGEAALADVESYLSQRLDDWMIAIDDPILRGPVPNPNLALAGYDCLWGRFPPLDPVAGKDRFRIVTFRDFGEKPL